MSDLRRQVGPHAADVPVPRTIVVEDDAPTRRALATLLRANGFAVEAVSSAEAALLALEGPRAPDVVLTDLDLPGMDGLQFLSNLAEKAHPRCAVLMTGADVDYDSATLKRYNVTFLRKPIDFSALLRLISGPSTPTDGFIGQSLPN